MRAAILLAAGGSRRFGRGDKLLAPLNGRPLVSYAIDRALGAGTRRVVMVVPSAGGRVARVARRRREARLHLIVARDHRRGMGASLRAGLAALRPIEREALILLGDMPGARMPRRLRIPSGRLAARPIVAGIPGHPMLVRSAAARALIGQGEDRGLIARLDPAQVALVPAGAGDALDIDTRAALVRARRGVRR